MKVIKRDGHVVDYSPEKIEAAIQKANAEVEEEFQANEFALADDEVLGEGYNLIMVLMKFLPLTPNTHAIRTMKYLSSVFATASSPSSLLWP